MRDRLRDAASAVYERVRDPDGNLIEIARYR